MTDSKRVILTEGQKKGQKPAMPIVPPRPQSPPPSQHPKTPNGPSGS